MFLGRSEGVRDTKTNKLVVSTLIASHKLHAISMYLLVCVLCQYYDILQPNS